MKTMMITVDAAQYEEDGDECLAAAARDVSDALQLAGWDLSPAWTDDEGTTITLSIPTPRGDDARGWERLRALEGL